MNPTFFISLVTLISNIQSRNFQAYSYDEIVFKLEKWQTEHPNIFKLYTARQKYNLSLPNTVKCSEKYGECEHHIVIITNHETWNNDLSRPHVFLSGALHGNEQVGPTVLVELIDYVLFEYSNNKDNMWMDYLLNHRVIILTPMTNAIGYAQSKREEQSEHYRIDPNRDFPYKVNPSNCMKTIAARTVNEIFREYLIQMAITFHGGMRAIGFEWGAPNHPKPKDYSPDHIAQLELVSNMQLLGGHTKKRDTWYYPIGTLNKVVYPVSGGMEDWAYGGSWDTQNVAACIPNTYTAYNKERTVYNDAMLRAFNFLIEASDAKLPRSDWGHIKNDWNDIWQVDNDEYDGHVPRNIRISMFVINSVMPYVMIRNYPRMITWDKMNNVFLDDNTKQMEWFVSGAVSLYEYDVLYSMDSNGNTHNEMEWNVLQMNHDAMWRETLDLSDRDTISKMFKFSIDILTELTVEWMKQIVSTCDEMDNMITVEHKVYCPVRLSIRVKVDDEWRDNRDLKHLKIVETYPEGIPPQSHVVNARNKDRLKWNMTNNKYFVNAKQWWYAVKAIKTDIYFEYDTEYAQNTHDDQYKGTEQKPLVVESRSSIGSISWIYVVLLVFVIGIVVYLIYKYKSMQRNRRRIGTKTYTRVSQISIV